MHQSSPRQLAPSFYSPRLAAITNYKAKKRIAQIESEIKNELEFKYLNHTPPVRLWDIAGLNYHDKIADWTAMQLEKAANDAKSIAPREFQQEQRQKYDSVSEIIRFAQLDLAAIWSDIKEASKTAAEKAKAVYMLNYPHSTESLESIAKKLKTRFGFAGKTAEGIISRAKDPRAWRKIIRADLRRAREISWIYEAPRKINRCSPDATAEYMSAIKAQDAYAKSHKAVCLQDGSTVNIPTKSQAQKRTRTEYFVRINGIAKQSEADGKKPYLITLTLPSRYHPTTTRGRRIRVANEKYDNSTPADGNTFFRVRWKKFLRWTKGHASLNYTDARPITGVVVPEPHTDATPHWHVVAFCNPDDIQAIKQKLIQLFGEENDTPQILRRRVDVQPITARNRNDDPNASDAQAAIAYVMSYVVANETDKPIRTDNGTEARETNPKGISYHAWRLTWGLRSLNFFGDSDGPGISVYRAMRRQKAQGKLRQDYPEAAAAADAGEWSAFKKAAAKLSILYSDDIDTNGETEVQKTNAYGEFVKRAVGITEKVYITTTDGRLLKVASATSKYKPKYTYEIQKTEEPENPDDAVTEKSTGNEEAQYAENTEYDAATSPLQRGGDAPPASSRPPANYSLKTYACLSPGFPPDKPSAAVIPTGTRGAVGPRPSAHILPFPTVKKPEPPPKIDLEMAKFASKPGYSNNRTAPF